MRPAVFAAGNSERVQPGFAPPGYCPKCDYPASPGTCPECGYLITDDKLRKRPRVWIHKHARLLTITVLVLAGAVYLGRSRPELVPYLPTGYLLDLQCSPTDLGKSARAELAARFKAGKLAPSQRQRFVKQWVDISWRSGPPAHPDPVFVGLQNNIKSLGFPTGHTFPPFQIQETVLRVRVDGRATSDRSLLQLPAHNVLPIPSRSLSSVPLKSFRSSAIAVRFSSSQETATIEINTQVNVIDMATRNVLSTWAMSHAVKVRVLAGPPHANPRWQKGMEDLMFPLGKIPGEFDPGIP